MHETQDLTASEAMDDLSLEAAIVEALEDVVSRSEMLQQHLVDLPGAAHARRAGDLGSPARLHAFATGAAFETAAV